MTPSCRGRIWPWRAGRACPRERTTTNCPPVERERSSCPPVERERSERSRPREQLSRPGHRVSTRGPWRARGSTSDSRLSLNVPLSHARARGLRNDGAVRRGQAGEQAGTPPAAHDAVVPPSIQPCKGLVSRGTVVGAQCWSGGRSSLVSCRGLWRFGWGIAALFSGFGRCECVGCGDGRGLPTQPCAWVVVRRSKGRCVGESCHVRVRRRRLSGWRRICVLRWAGRFRRVCLVRIWRAMCLSWRSSAMVSASLTDRPRRSSFMIGTKPANDTRFGSSNDAETARVVLEICTYEVVICPVNLNSRQVLFSLIRSEF